MKYILLTISLLTTLATPTFVFAGAAGGGATEITQIANNIQLIPINVNSLVTSVATHGTFLKTVILDPIANQLINQAIKGAAGNILSWVNGGFAGQPLIVSNPAKAIQDTGLKAAASSLKAIPSNSLFGNSVFTTLSAKYSFDALPIKDKVKTLSKDDGPSIIQSSMCNDDMLTSLATEDVAKNGEVTNAAIVARKNELYAYACQGSADDPATAKKLQSIAAQRPEVGGWDYILCASSGSCNDATKQAKIADAVAIDAANKAHLKELDLYEGLNTESATECDDSSDDDTEDSSDDSSDSGDEVDGSESCDNEVVTTPADSVQGLTNLAQGSSLQRMFNISTDGSFSSALTNFVTSMISSGLNSAFKGTSSRVVNSSTVTSGGGAVQQDLTSTSSQAEFAGPMIKGITLYQTSLTDLQGIDQNYKADMLGYEAKIKEGASCYQGLLQDGLVSSNDPGIVFYQSRQDRIDQVRNLIVPELAKISDALTYVNDTLTKIGASKSSQEITNIYYAYDDKIKTGGYPDINAPDERKGQYETDKSDISRDAPQVDSYLQKCNSIRAQGNVY